MSLLLDALKALADKPAPPPCAVDPFSREELAELEAKRPGQPAAVANAQPASDVAPDFVSGIAPTIVPPESKPTEASLPAESAETFSTLPGALGGSRSAPASKQLPREEQVPEPEETAPAESLPQGSLEAQADSPEEKKPEAASSGWASLWQLAVANPTPTEVLPDEPEAELETSSKKASLEATVVDALVRSASVEPETDESMQESAAETTATDSYEEENSPLATEEPPSASEPVAQVSEVEAVETVDSAVEEIDDIEVIGDRASGEQPSSLDMKYIFAPWFAAHGLEEETVEAGEADEEVLEARESESFTAEGERDLDRIADADSESLTAVSDEASAAGQADSVTQPENDTVEEPVEIVEEAILPAEELLEDSHAELPDQPEKSSKETWELYDRAASPEGSWKRREPGLRPAVAEKSSPLLTAEEVSRSEEVAPDISPVEATTSSPAKSIPSEPASTTSEQARKTEESQPIVEDQPAPQPDLPAQTSSIAAALSSLSEESASRSKVVEQPAEVNENKIKPPNLATVELAEKTPIRVTEPYLRLATRICQTLGKARPQAIVLAAAEERAILSLDLGQLAKAFTLAEEGDLLVLEGNAARPQLATQLGALPGRHPRFQAGGGELADRILRTEDDRIHLLPFGSLRQPTMETVDPLLIARCKRHYSLIVIDAGLAKPSAVQSLVSQADLGVLTAILHHTPRALASQSATTLRQSGIRMLHSVLCESRSRA